MLVTLLGLVAVLAVLFVGGVLATRDTGLLRDAPADRAPEPGPVNGPEDLEAVRFSLVLRGYRMSEVDEVLDRAGATLAAVQQQLAETRHELASVREQLTSLLPASSSSNVLPDQTRTDPQEEPWTIPSTGPATGTSGGSGWRHGDRPGTIGS